MTKYIKYGIFSFAAAIIGFTGCKVDEMQYNDRTYTTFTDSIAYMPVTVNADQLFEVEIASTNIAATDRNYIAEIVYNKSNAIEGYHFDVLNQNVTIPAGSRTAKLQLRGYFNRITNNDNLNVRFRLVSLHDDQWEMYSQEVNVSLIKCHPFNINDYVGDVLMTCTFPFGQEMTKFLLKTEKKNETTLILKSPFSDIYDITVKMNADPKEPFNRDVFVAEQPAFIDATYGKIYAESTSVAPSYYIVPDRALVLYLTMYIPKVGSFGTYPYIIQWISPEQAEAMENETGSPYSLARTFSNPAGFTFNKNINR